MSNINIFALGGQDENGKDLFILEVEKDIYVINAGIKFPINDKWGVDGIIADTGYLLKNKNRIKGVFITHGHDEAFAALPWFLMDMPGIKIYGSSFTIKLIENRISKYKIGHSNYKLEAISGSTKIGSINIKAFEIANSIPGSYVYNFQTPDGDILFFSNLTIDDLGPYGKTDLQKIKNESNDILALLMDSRKANYNGKSSDKKSISNLVEKAFSNKTNEERVIVGAYDEEMWTIQEIIDLANKYERPIAFYGSAFDNMYKILLKHYPIKNQPNKLINFRDVNKYKNAVVLVTGTWSRIYDRFNRISSRNDVFLRLKENDHIVMITPPINGMEVEYSQMLDEVAKISPNIISVTNNDFYNMRATKDDIYEICSVLKPKHFLPTSSLYRYKAVAIKSAIKAGVAKDKTVLLQNGKILYLQNGKIASQKGRVKQIGDIIIQGFGVGDVSFEVIKERKTLSSGGLISIAAQISRKNKQLFGEINVQVVGVVVKTELNGLIELVRSIVIEKFDQVEKFDYRELQNTIRRRVQRVISKKINKEPLVAITFYEV